MAHSHNGIVYNNENEWCTTMHKTMSKYNKSIFDQKNPETIPCNSIHAKLLKRQNQSLLLEIRAMFTHRKVNMAMEQDFRKCKRNEWVQNNPKCGLFDYSFLRKVSFRIYIRKLKFIW